ncbi:cytochrome P450 4C1-like [Onthophagus taurus]|uniref:cytochrome P450 4C1-like n=1 Tax=Onthophagus taurus TaxID=166361 RepID=UPI0039BE5EA6
MFQYLLALILGLVAWSLIGYIKWRIDVYNKIEKIRGPKRYPFVGTLHIFHGASRTDIYRIMMETIDKYGPFFRTWKMWTPEVHVMKPEHFEQIMGSSVLLKKASGYKYLSSWLGDGLLLSDGKKWHQRRKMITPTFHFKILDTFMKVFEEKSELLIKYLEERCDGQAFDMYPYINHCALDIICETAMGVSTNAMSDRNSSYTQAIYNITILLNKRFLTPLHQTKLYPYLPEGKQFEHNLKIMHDFTNKIISERRNLLKSLPQRKGSIDDVLMSQKKRLSFLDLLLDASDKLTDADIREEVDTFMFEGHDTTTAAVSWCLLLLANHPDIQEKVYQELKSVLQGKTAPASISDLNKLSYLECCVKEALRLYPSVPVIGRKLTEDVVIDGYEIPKETDANLHIYKVHRNPDIYPNPDKFDPDRFLPENSSKRHPYAYVPFSAGPRNCIGQKFAIYEEKTMIASIINAYKVLPVDSLDSLTLVFEVILRPINGINLKLQKRVN